jgi:acetyltransferase-like isoleucine patch superfamily enzyme
MLLLSLLLFALVLVLPALPSMVEVVRPRDDGRLFIAERYVRDARWFGRAFRLKLAPFVAAARESGPSRAAMHMRMEEEVQWAPDLRIPALERLRGIGVGEQVVVGHGAGIRDAYALERLEVESDVVARTLTSNDTMHLGNDVRVLRWIDADGDIVVGARSDLGISASGGARVTLGERVRFERVWGAPVACATPAREPFALDAVRATVLDAAAVGERASVIIYGAARVASGTHVPAHLKVHGPVAIEPGATIGGNLIVRGDVTIAGGVAIGGHIFAEGHVHLGPGTRVARPGVAKTVYATGEVLLADDVEVFGWVVSETGGSTL